MLFRSSAGQAAKSIDDINKSIQTQTEKIELLSKAEKDLIVAREKAKILNAKIISDGGSLGKTGNKAKALVTGASAVMLGQTLAGTLSSPGLIINRNGKKCKYFRGMASTIAHLENQHAKGKEEIEENFNAEGIDGFVEIKGTVHDVIHQIKIGRAHV